MWDYADNVDENGNAPNTAESTGLDEGNHTLMDLTGAEPFPSFSTLLSNYPLPYEERPDRTPIDAKKPLDDETGDNFLYFNQCAIRISIALHKSGVDITGAKNSTNPGGQTYANGNVIGATNLAIHIKNAILGAPEQFNGMTQKVAELLSGRTGILYFEGFVEEVNGRNVRGPSNTLMELWDNDHYMSSYPFTQMFDAKKIWFWEVK